MPRTPDWEAIHRRLSAAEAIISGDGEGGPEVVREILLARARAAARPPIEPEDVERLEVLAFSLAAESYSVETCHVARVCQLENLTELPCTPPFIAGVMNLRGRILAIIDLRVFFDLPAKGLTELNRIVVLKSDRAELGLLADSVEGVRSVRVTELQQGIPTITGIRERFLRGITGQALAVLDGTLLLESEILRIDEEVSK